jgi:para-nitrobenzyl esterase
MGMNKISAIIGILILTCCISFARKPVSGNINIHSVFTESGSVSGIRGEDSAVMVFKGVPFAAPPVGELRWKPPVPCAKWESVRKCDHFAPSAMQAKPVPFAMWSKEFMAPEEPLSEDCLYLNIWTAARSDHEKRPVIVWIHGGGFTGGSGSVPLYDGEQMAKKGVVFITINYRLGIFGFLAHPDLIAESPYQTSGNYDILDQIAALEWISRNIAAFGGDPRNVTMAGQSAGAFSVNALMVSPMAKGLFQRAIAESGGMFGGNLLIGSGLEQAEQTGVRIATSLHASSIEALRSVSVEALLKAGGRMGVTIDGVVIPSSFEIFAAGKQNDVPLITGWNADDGVFFGPPKNAEAFIKETGNKYGDLTVDFLKVFPAGTDEEAAQSQKILSQLAFGWQNYCWAKMQATSGRNNAYLYYFSRVPPGLPNYGAFHSAEFGYALKTLRLWNRPFVDWDYKLADIISSYWANFASSGNPNGKGLPEWPVFTPAKGRIIELGDTVEARDLPFRDKIEFLDRYEEMNRNKK